MFYILFCFLVPLLGAIRINFVGEITMAEPVLIAIVLISLRRVWLVCALQVPRRIYLLLLLGLIMLVLSDYYRGSLPSDYLRGWARTVMLIISYTACSVLVGTDLSRAGAMMAGIVLQPIVAYYAYHPDVDVYKSVFGYAVSASAFGVAMILRGEKRAWPVIFPILAGVLALLNDCRSLAGITWCAAAYYMLISLQLLKEDRGWKVRIVFALFWAILSASMLELYSTLAAGGHLTDAATTKYEQQLNDTGSFSVLGGRQEAYFTVPKIIQSPLIGWGSWAKDPTYVAERCIALGINYEDLMVASNGSIPNHSHLLGAMMEAGILGGLIWLYVLYLIVRIFAGGWIASTGIWSGLFSFILVNFVWDIFFSPIGAERRLNNGLYLWLVTLIVLVSKGRKIVFQPQPARMPLSRFGRHRRIS